jgi:hypothetical protein
VKISIGKHRKQYSLLFMDTYTASKNVEVQVEREHHIIEVLIHKEHGGMKREFLPSFLPPSLLPSLFPFCLAETHLFKRAQAPYLKRVRNI